MGCQPSVVNVILTSQTYWVVVHEVGSVGAVVEARVTGLACFGSVFHGLMLRWGRAEERTAERVLRTIGAPALARHCLGGTGREGKRGRRGNEPHD